jgi:hypothetical protein
VLFSFTLELCMSNRVEYNAEAIYRQRVGQLSI